MVDGKDIQKAALEKMLKEIAWDYTLSKEELLEIFLYDTKGYSLSKEALEVRLLEYFGWHQIVSVVGINRALALLENEVIERIFPRSYQKQLYGVRRILSTETLSASR